MEFRELFSSFGVAVSRETKIGVDLEFLLGTMFEPVIYILLFGPLMGKLTGGVDVNGERISYLAYMFPGVLTLVSINQGFRGAATFIQDRFYGGLETLFTLPVSRSVLFVAKIFAACLRALVAMAVLSVLATVISKDVSMTLTGFVGSFLVNSTLVVMLSSFMIYLLSKSQNPNLPLAISGILILPMMFLSTVFYPESVFAGSKILKILVSINPMTHASKLVRSFIYVMPLQPSVLAVSLTYLLVLASLGMLLGEIGFRRTLER
jgi:ABC-2 type transport system permease protein